MDKQTSQPDEPARGQDPASTEALYRRIAFRLVPLLFVCYLVAYLDRINVGLAKLQMQQALGFSDAVYGLGAGIFFVGYIMFEVPTNLWQRRIGARKTIARIMVCWGIVGACMAFVSTATEFYVLRFLLGVFEAGFFPGVVYYFGCWFPEFRRGQILGLFMTGFPIAGMVGGPVSGWAMTALNGLHGMDGWQWLYVVEALPAVVLGVIVWAWLDDDFDRARWLDDGERRLLRNALDKERAGTVSHSKASLLGVIRDPRVYVMVFAYFTFICGTYALSFWLPTVLKAAGAGTVSQIGWLSAIPYGLSAVGMVLICRSSDRRLERRWHAAACSTVGAVCLCALPSFEHDLAMTLVLLTVATTGIFTAIPLLWAIVSDFFTGSPAAAGAIAYVNSLGLIGGFVSPFAMGWLKTATGRLDSGLYVVTALLIAGAAALIVGPVRRGGLPLTRPVRARSGV